jgi:hypothetical protein
MSNRNYIVLAIALLAALGWRVSPGAVGGSPVKEPPPADKAATDGAAKLMPKEWAGKVLLVTSGFCSVPLENAQIRKLADENYIVGRGVEDTFPSTASSRVTWVRMAKVERFVEFANVKEYLKAAEEFRAATGTTPESPAVPFLKDED